MTLTISLEDGIYIAGKYDAKDRLRPYRDMMRQLGWIVSSSWMDEHNKATTPAERETEANRDMQEVALGSVLILDTLDDSNTGGREVEAGAALILGHQVVLIGPERNVFHSLIPVRYDTWIEFFNDLQAY